MISNVKAAEDKKKIPELLRTIKSVPTLARHLRRENDDNQSQTTRIYDFLYPIRRFASVYLDRLDEGNVKIFTSPEFFENVKNTDIYSKMIKVHQNWESSGTLRRLAQLGRELLTATEFDFYLKDATEKLASR